jgi:hypothetical protein
MIKPTPGRVVWFRPGSTDILECALRVNIADDEIQPLAAIIAAVHDDRHVTLTVFDADGDLFPVRDVQLNQGDGQDVPNDGKRGYAEWMPYQLGQAAKASLPATLGGEPLIGTAAASMIATTASMPAPGQAPRVTKEHIDSLIKGEDYVVMPDGRTTICQLTLVNGFTVRGESSCVSIENFDADKGREYSYENAVEKIWELEGYLLAQRLYERAVGIESVGDKVDRIARVCHEVNREYCRALGDFSQLRWNAAPDWQKSSARLGVELHLNNPDASPSASHESWMKQKVDEGWVYGPIKNPENKQHPCIVPFNQLPVEQQAKDFIFRAVVHALTDMEASC